MLLAVGLLAHVALKLWLNARQVRHVAAHRAAVPQAYAHTITLADHQKAADYTLAKARLAQWDILLDAAVLLGWTLLGGLDALNQWLLTFMQPGLAQQVALVVAFMLIGGLMGLPLSLLQTFGVEQRFGFNKMTPALWLSDLFKGLLVGAVLGLPLLALVLWLMDVGGALWWLWAWAALVVASRLLTVWHARRTLKADLSGGRARREVVVLMVLNALDGAIWGGFGTTGQRCTAASRVVVHEKIYRLYEHGHPTVLYRGIIPMPDGSELPKYVLTFDSGVRFVGGFASVAFKRLGHTLSTRLRSATSKRRT